jgi:DNA-directed RNA polymerase alpha subunit
VEGTLIALVGTEKAPKCVKAAEDARFSRLMRTAFDDNENGINRLDIGSVWMDLMERLEVARVQDLARFTRDEIAAFPKVGKATLAKLESAMAERGVSWAEEAVAA